MHVNRHLNRHHTFPHRLLHANLPNNRSKHTEFSMGALVGNTLNTKHTRSNHLSKNTETQKGGENTTNIKNTTISIAVIAAFAVLTVVATSVIVQYQYPNHGSIDTLELWIDNTRYFNNTPVDWGDCIAGETYYFENMAVTNKVSTTLTVYITTYGLPTDWTLSWTCNNTDLASGDTMGSDLILTIPDTSTTWPDWGFWLKAEA